MRSPHYQAMLSTDTLCVLGGAYTGFSCRSLKRKTAFGQTFVFSTKPGAAPGVFGNAPQPATEPRTQASGVADSPNTTFQHCGRFSYESGRLIGIPGRVSLLL